MVMFGHQSIFHTLVIRYDRTFKSPGHRRRRSRSHLWVLALTASSHGICQPLTRIFFLLSSKDFKVQRGCKQGCIVSGVWCWWSLLSLSMTLTPPFPHLFDGYHICFIHGHNLPVNVHGCRVLYPQESDNSAYLFRCPLLQLGRRFPTNAQPAQRLLYWRRYLPDHVLTYDTLTVCYNRLFHSN